MKQLEHFLAVHVFGGTGACDWVPRTAESGPDDMVLRPVIRDKILQVLRYETDPGSRAAYGANGANIDYSEERELYDSSQLNTDRLEMDVARIRQLLMSDTTGLRNVLFFTGTDSAAYQMHAVAEGISKEMLGNRTILGICFQDPFPARPQDCKQPYYTAENLSPELLVTAGRRVKDLNNALALVRHPDMRGMIGLFCGGLVLPPRGLHKVNIGDEQPYTNRYDVIARAGQDPENAAVDAYVPVPYWMIQDKHNVYCPRGRPWEYTLQSGIESWPFDATSDYANLPAAMYGLAKSWRKLGFKEQTAHGLVVQAPGSRNIREGHEDLLNLHRAGEIGRKSNIPLVVIGDPLQPHWDGGKETTSIYGGDFGRMRAELDKIAKSDKRCREGRTAVISGGKLARAEVKVELSRIMRRARDVHDFEGWELIDYVQRCLLEYEEFVAGIRQD